jgi:hypothetical protein
MLSLAMIYGLGWLAESLGFRIPMIGLVSHLIYALILAPVLMIPLSKINRRLLDSRKGRGRDIEAEERHENLEAGIISLRPIQPKTYISQLRGEKLPMHHPPFGR